MSWYNVSKNKQEREKREHASKCNQQAKDRLIRALDKSGPIQVISDFSKECIPSKDRKSG